MTEKETAPLVIGLTGPGGVGKTTIAEAIALATLEAQGWRPVPAPKIIAIGEPLKDMLAALLDHAGMDKSAVRRAIYGDGKRETCAALGGHTPTHAMQTLGTEWGRECIAPDLWLSIWESRARTALALDSIVINDSVRFENEAAAIRNLGGVVVRLTGRAGDLAPDHISEAGVVPDFEIENVGTPDDVADKLISRALGCRLTQDQSGHDEKAKPDKASVWGRFLARMDLEVRKVLQI